MKGWLVTISLFLLAILASCSGNLQCPAYQSYFILDNSNYPRHDYPKLEASSDQAIRWDYPDPSYHPFQNPIREEYFAYLDADSVPKERNVEKDNFGLVEKKTLRARRRSLNTIPMEVVIPPAPDSLLFGGDDLLLADLENLDSLSQDSLASLGKSYQYNVDQKYYLWYLRNKLVWKEDLQKEQEEAAAAEEEGAGPGEEAQEGEVKQGFFKKTFSKLKGLFGKKEKIADPAVDGEPTEEAPDPNDGF